MTDLQEQLKNIYFRVQKRLITEEGFVAQVEAAYKGAGYRHNLADGLWDWARKKDLEMMGYMTGQEWYNRFEKVTEENRLYDFAPKWRFKSAAKIAADMEDRTVEMDVSKLSNAPGSRVCFDCLEVGDE
jgi:hypothetical protein